MFNMKKLLKNSSETFISKNCSIHGNLKSNKIIKINGFVRGNIYSKNKVILSESGCCHGNIYSNNAIINGKVKGNITCNNLLILQSCSNIEGNLSIKNIIIMKGSCINGFCSMNIKNNLYDKIDIVSKNNVVNSIIKHH
ncbi:polymer-forming cytoskeletal protein [Clostridium niameyense]|uniref:Polymer-forming cytoskeletal protein n=1 Tax=Clostridium niameyense TaxID=1622073 RepID=A0A6M0RBG4_9CLOT|nr:polymer-forming cytoskeletal protein [Clostridium niameyense]NEZ47563.1 polymer-forming cytoskeletal protein [Clostridium niameyense]